MRKIYLTLLVAAFSSMNAAQAQTGPGWSKATEITNLRVFNGKHLYGQAKDLSTILTCPNSNHNSNNNFLLSFKEGDLSAEVFSILLAAQSQEKRVQLYRTGVCTGNGQNAFAKVNGVKLLN